MSDPNEVQELLSQAGPQQPSAPDSAMSLGSMLAPPQVQIAQPKAPTPTPPTSAPTTLDSSLNLGQRFAQALLKPANGVPLNFGSTLVRAAVDVVAVPAIVVVEM